MALIRLCGHFPNNPGHIDKLIAIKGLPNEWIFRPIKKMIAGELVEGLELLHPWEPDIEANIPKDIRHLCEPVEIVQVFPPIEKGRDSVWDRRTIIGIRFNFMTQPGQELWEKIERYLDRMTPRDQKVPVPVMVAPNHIAAFSPHIGRRSVRGSLELQPTEIPEVDLRVAPLVPVAVVAAPIIVPPVVVKQAEEPKPTVLLPCDQCDKSFFKERQLSMHKLGAHRVRKAALA